MNSKKSYNYKNTTVFDCKIVNLSKIENRAGNITILENLNSVPFDINRIYYLYDIPGGEERGGHGHYELEQFIIAVSGSFEIELFDGKNKQKIYLNRPYFALHIIPGIWREITNFSSGAICLVIASHKYSEQDYIRSIEEFVTIVKKHD